MTAVALTAELIRIDNVHLELIPGTAGESATADYLCARLDRAGFVPHVVTAGVTGRPSLAAVAWGPAGGGVHAVDEWVDVRQVRAYAVALPRVLTTGAENVNRKAAHAH